MEGDGGGKFKTVCVFCGSRSGNRPSFSDAALELGRRLVEKNINLVYGGGSVGLMGLISQTVHDGGCHVLGVIPTALMTQEIAGETIGETKIVSGMHERKSKMAKYAHPFIALPGYGTMEEVLEIITWSELGIHDKPVFVIGSVKEVRKAEAILRGRLLPDQEVSAVKHCKRVGETIIGYVGCYHCIYFKVRFYDFLPFGGHED